MVVRQAVFVSVIGVGLGLLGVMGSTRLIESLLYEVAALDASTLSWGTLFLLVVALLASLMPAYRAARLSPLTALRAE